MCEIFQAKIIETVKLNKNFVQKTLDFTHFTKNKEISPSFLTTLSEMKCKIFWYWCVLKTKILFFFFCLFWPKLSAEKAKPTPKFCNFLTTTNFLFLSFPKEDLMRSTYCFLTTFVLSYPLKRSWKYNRFWNLKKPETKSWIDDDTVLILYLSNNPMGWKKGKERI